MVRAAGAALATAIPAAKAAAVVGGGRRRPAAADPRVTAPGSTAARQRAAVEQIKANRAPEPAPPAATDPAPTSSGAGPSLPALPAMPAAAATGSGFALGVLAWALGLAYLQNGSTGVKSWLRAKFFNITSTDPNPASTPAGGTGSSGGPNYTGGLTPGQFTAGVAGLPTAVALGTPAGQAAVNDPNGILGQLSGLNLAGIANLGAYSGMGGGK